MPSRESAAPEVSDADALPAAAAERLLERASQLDAARANDVPVTRLRTAAAEAGISRSAFDGALAELHAADSSQSEPARTPGRASARRWGGGWLAGAAVALFAAGALATSGGRVLTGADAPSAATVEEAVLLRCLPPGEALELVRPLLNEDRASTARWNPTVAPRVVTIRTTPARLQRAKALLAEHDGRGPGTCPAPRAPAATP